jgi:hypothetical protein
VIVDILETIARMLVDEEVVGRRGQHFRVEYSREYNSDGEQTYGNVTSASWFKKTERAVQKKWGEDVYLLGFLISCDKTHVDRLGGISVWPCYITILNLDAKVRCTQRGSDIIGYVPIMSYSDSQLGQILKENCGILRNIEEVIKMCKYYFEQSFHFNLLEPIRRREVEGPVILQIGQEKDNVRKFIPKLMAYVCEYTYCVLLYLEHILYFI